MSRALFAWLIVAQLWVVALLNYVDRQIIFSVFPLLKNDLQLTDVELGLLSTVFLWVYGLVSPFAGYLGDRFGRKRTIVISLVIWTAVTFLTGYSRNFGDLLIARALMGGENSTVGFIGSVLGAMLLLFIYRLVAGRRTV